MYEYRVTEIYDVLLDKFTCPFCKWNEKINLSSKSKLKVCCKKCKKSFTIILPEIKKKLIYLDQWFISNLYDNKLNNSDLRYYESLIEKLEELVRLQRIYIVTSNIHVRETSRISISDKQRNVFDKLNSLARGYIAKNSSDIFVAQYKRILFNQKEEFHWSDILRNNPHEWITTNIISTNYSLVKYHERYNPRNDYMDNLFRQIIDKQSNNIGVSSSPSVCFDYIKKLWIEDIIYSGVDLYEKIASKSNDDNLKVLNCSNVSRLSYSSIIKPLIDKCSNYGNDYKEVIELIRQSEGLPVLANILISLEAGRLYSALQSKVSGMGITGNKKKFSIKYGISSQNDSLHISSFSPYVDILITDDKVIKSLAQEPVRKFLIDLNCEFFSSDTICDFESRLDEILNIVRSDEVEITRKLLIGKTKEENELLNREAIEKFYYGALLDHVKSGN